MKQFYIQGSGSFLILIGTCQPTFKYQASDSRGTRPGHYFFTYDISMHLLHVYCETEWAMMDTRFKINIFYI